MPGGSEYKGPKEVLELYTEVVAAAEADTAVKGAKNPYTSRNGHMFSFLDSDGVMALRLPEDQTEDFTSRYESGPVMAYGAVMRGYVSVPPELLADTAEIVSWFDRSHEWIGTLPAKPTKK